MAVVGAANEIAFPMTGYGAIFDGGWPVLNRDGIRDFPKSLVLQTRRLRSANGSIGSETGLQLIFQDASGLNIQSAIDGFVGHAFLLARRVLALQPHGDLLGRPLPVELCRDNLC